MNTRRSALQVMAAVASALPTLQAQHQHEAEAVLPTDATPRKPKIFSAEEFALLSILTDLIIPASETPGATAAGVPLLIDGAAAKNESLAKRWRDALSLVNTEANQKFGSSFGDLSNERQIAVLTGMSEQPQTPGGRVFVLLKNATIDLYYTTKAGLVTELGWHGNTYLSEFPGCTHPEHQV